MENSDETIQNNPDQASPYVMPTDPGMTGSQEQTKTKALFFAVGGIFFVILVAIASYNFGKQSNIQESQPVNQQQPTVTQIVTPSTFNTPASTRSTVPTLPEKWSYKTNGECSVEVALPPKLPPYYIESVPKTTASPGMAGDSARFWDFPRGGVYPNMLTKLIAGKETYKQSSVMHASPEEASGYISSAVVVSCIPNTSSLDTSSMVSLLKTKLSEFNKKTGEKGMEADEYILASTTDVERWGKKVVDAEVSETYKNTGGQPSQKTVRYTLFATPTLLYEVRVLGASEDQFVKETASKIFEYLRFQ